MYLIKMNKIDQKLSEFNLNNRSKIFMILRQVSKDYEQRE